MAQKHMECPVFRPTLDDLRSKTFEEYIEEIEPLFEREGVCRIVTPEGWTPRRGGYDDVELDLSRPIRQHATGRQGLYRTLLVENKSMPLSEFRDLAQSGDAAPPKDADPETLERKFWKNIPLNPPLYGADVEGSLFDDRQKFWNIKRLSSLLSRTLAENGASIPGVTQPYLYAGSWRSFFAWHTEDMDLHSVNYLHCGASKTWYVIPPFARDRFEQLMHGLLPDIFRYCSEFLRHKELLVSPALLAMHSIPFVKLEHHAREFVVVYPGAYHAGFNHGYNLAESMNFATRAWVPVGANAGFCCCRGDSVKIDMRLFGKYMSPDLKREVDATYESSSDEEDEEEEEEEEEQEEEEEEEEEEEVEVEVEVEESSEEEEEESVGAHSNDENASPQHQHGLRPARALKPTVKRREQLESEGKVKCISSPSSPTSSSPSIAYRRLAAATKEKQKQRRQSPAEKQQLRLLLQQQQEKQRQQHQKQDNAAAAANVRRRPKRHTRPPARVMMDSSDTENPNTSKSKNKRTTVAITKRQAPCSSSPPPSLPASKRSRGGGVVSGLDASHVVYTSRKQQQKGGAGAAVQQQQNRPARKGAGNRLFDILGGLVPSLARAHH